MSLRQSVAGVRSSRRPSGRRAVRTQAAGGWFGGDFLRNVGARVSYRVNTDPQTVVEETVDAPRESRGAELERAAAAAETHANSLAGALDVAVLCQDFSGAAEIRDTLNAVKAADPVASLVAALEQAVADERYEDAAALNKGALKLLGTWSGNTLECESDPFGQLLFVENNQYGSFTATYGRPAGALSGVVGGSGPKVPSVALQVYADDDGELHARYLHHRADEVVSVDASITWEDRDTFVVSRPATAEEAHARKRGADRPLRAMLGGDVTEEEAAIVERLLPPPALKTAMLCKGCRTVIAYAGAKPIDVRNIGGFNEESLGKSGRQAEHRSATRLIVPGGEQEMDFLAIRDGDRFFGGEVQEEEATVASKWFDGHKRRQLVCSCCRSLVGFTYDQTDVDADDESAAAELFDELDATAAAEQSAIASLESLVRRGGAPAAPPPVSEASIDDLEEGGDGNPMLERPARFHGLFLRTLVPEGKPPARPTGKATKALKAREHLLALESEKEEALNALAGNVGTPTAEEAAAEKITAASGALAAPPGPGSLGRTRLPLRMRFTRERPFVAGHELEGFFVGRYGEHGPEVVRLEYEGNDVVATKVTGDPNVPAGEATFRAKMDEQAVRRGRWQNLPQEWGVEAIYEGQGRVAKRGFADPRYVPGVLLKFRKGCGLATGGATFGFLWENDKRPQTLTLFHRVV